MDNFLRKAARTGNVRELYRLIQRHGNILRRFDEVEFIDTPLHIAAEEGCMLFAMEMTNLKPSFARKLNQQGLSPIHLAVIKGHNEMVFRFLEIDKDLVRIRGKKGMTPLHYISKVGNNEALLNRFLEAFPDCIRHVTTQNRTSLHIAVKNKRLDVVQVLIQTLRNKDYCREVVNRKDEDGNTALHIAASNNQPQMLKLLLDCKADKHATNQDGLTAMNLAHQHNNKESISILRDILSPRVSNFKRKLKKQIIKYATMAPLLTSDDIDNISSEDRNSLLVILGLLLTTTYQATLSPPGGILQGQSCSTATEANGDHNVAGISGISAMHQAAFLMFYIPIYVVFIVAFLLTLALLKPFPHGFRTALQILLAFLAICFVQSICLITPTHIELKVIIIIFAVLFLNLLVFMFIAYRVSKLGVSILGCYLSPAVLLVGSMQNMPCLVLGYVIQGCWFFLLMYDEFWEGTTLVVGYCLFFIIAFTETHVPCLFFGSGTILGCWLFLSLCRFCVKQCCKRCNT